MGQLKKLRATTMFSVVVVIALLFFSTGTGLSQGGAGSIRGVVSDVTGAIVPGVDIQATNLGTNQQVTTVSNETGTYVLEFMPVGSYQVEAELPGFKRYSYSPVTVSVTATTTLNFTLEIGEVAELVTVEGSVAALLQTSNAEVSTNMERRLVIDLPLELGAATQVAGSGRRQVESFIFLTPGITGTGWSKHVLGSPQHSTQTIIDGIPFALQESPGLSERTPPPL